MNCHANPLITHVDAPLSIFSGEKLLRTVCPAKYAHQECFTSRQMGQMKKHKRLISIAIFKAYSFSARWGIRKLPKDAREMFYKVKKYSHGSVTCLGMSLTRGGGIHYFSGALLIRNFRNRVESCTTRKVLSPFPVCGRAVVLSIELSVHPGHIRQREQTPFSQPNSVDNRCPDPYRYFRSRWQGHPA